MKKLLLFSLVGFIVFGCTAIRNTSISEDMDYTYLALGDSYTFGEGVDLINTWPVELRNRLLERGYKVAPPRVVAKTGWTTRDLIRNFEREIDVHRIFDLVSIQIGVNNQYRKRPLSEFETELEELVRKAITQSRMRERGVFLLSIPDYGVTPFGAKNAEVISFEVDRFNAVIRRVAEEYNVDFFNITPSTREALTNKNLIARDSLHPSALMYRLWVDDIVDAVEDKFSPQ